MIKLISILLTIQYGWASLEAVTEDSIRPLLLKQIEEFKKPEKKQKGTLLAFVSRGPGSLEFQREFQATADTVNRQYTVGVIDCHFERLVCDLFRPKVFPFILLIKNDKVYEYNNLKAMNSITKQDLLDFLSGDLYKTEGNIFHENTSEFLVQMTGQQLGTLQSLFKQFEEWMRVAAKKLFKKAGLSHWEESAKVIMLLIVIMIPVCFIFILTLLGIIFGIINLASKY